MIMSIGGSPEPLKASIAKYKPEQVIFFTSQDSTQIAGEVLSALDSRPKVFYEITENPNLLFECYKTARACVDRISSLGAQSHEVMVDYTGGTKVMSAALILATTGHPFLFNYVGGDFRDRDKNGLGTVVDGKEKMFSEMKSSPQTNNVNYNFLCEMIPHHMGAVRMGENAMKYSICQELRPIISAIIHSQKEDIAKMQVLVRHYQST